MEYLLALAFVFFAASLASFLQVVIARTAREQSFIIGRSACDHCQKQLTWYDNVPLLSFLWLRGKCRACHKQIPATYFLSELLATAWALLLVYLLTQTTYLSTWSVWELSVLFSLGLLLLFVVIADLQELIVPDLFSALLLVIVVADLLVRSASASVWLASLGGGLLAVGFLLVLYQAASKLLGKEALGLGDLKLMLPLGMSLAWPWVILQLFLAFVIGGLFAILVLLAGKKRFGQALPFAPFLVLAFVLTKVWGAEIWVWYINLII